MVEMVRCRASLADVRTFRCWSGELVIAWPAGCFNASVSVFRTRSLALPAVSVCVVAAAAVVGRVRRSFAAQPLEYPTAHPRHPAIAPSTRLTPPTHPITHPLSFFSLRYSLPFLQFSHSFINPLPSPIIPPSHDFADHLTVSSLHAPSIHSL